MKRRVLNLLISFDQFAWCLLTLGNADPDMTLSASSYRSELKGKQWAKIMRPFIDWLFSPLESNHCLNAYIAEIKRQQLPREMRCKTQ